MTINDILTAARIQLEASATSKKRALESVSELITIGMETPGTKEIFECLVGRERLGSTGLGHGVALPHARVPGLAGATGAFLRLREPVAYDAPDGQPVDLLFGLLVPEASTEQHLRILAELAENFADADVRKRLRNAVSAQEISALLGCRVLAA